MRDNNFFATKTLACGTKTWPITISLRQNIHGRHENLAANSGRPWMIDARTLHYSIISFNIHNSSENTKNIVTSNNNGMQHTDYTPSATLFPFITSVCVCVINSTVFQLCIVWGNHLYRHQVLTASRKAAEGITDQFEQWFHRNKMLRRYNAIVASKPRYTESTLT